mgnify:CR=1 FL=1
MSPSVDYGVPPLAALGLAFGFTALGVFVDLQRIGTVGTVSGAECGSLQDPEADLLVYEASHLAGERYDEVTRWWRELLGTVQVKTPEPQIDLLLNGFAPLKLIRRFLRTPSPRRGALRGSNR